MADVLPGWSPGLTGQHGIWSWHRPAWSSGLLTPVDGALRVTWDRRTVTVQTGRAGGWLLTLVEPATTVAEVRAALVAAGVLPEAVAR